MTFLMKKKKKKNHTHTHTIPKHILKKKREPSTLIRAIRKKKNPPKERRERERDCVGNQDWIGEMTSNLYRIK